MKKRCLAFVLCLMMLISFTAVSEDWTPLLSDDGWRYIGYTYGGVTFAVPADYTSYGLTALQKANGYLIVGGNRDFTLQLRVFEPEVMTYDAFKAIISEEKTAEVSTRMYGETEILTFRNTIPSEVSELYGIVLTGLDGRFYKISIFTGDDELFGEDAPVWEIARVVGETTRIQDFTEWGIENEPSKHKNSITDFFKRFKKDK